MIIKQHESACKFLFFFKNNIRPWHIFILALMVIIPMVMLEAIPAHDVANRYAPMADAFARGDWSFAFHPRVPMLHPLLAGIISYITGLNGFAACKVISVLFYALCVFPAYALFESLFSRRVAIWATLLTVFASHLMRLAFSGLRASMKEFAILLGVYAIIFVYRNRSRINGYLYCATAAAMLILCRVDTVLYAFALLFVLLCFDLRDQGKWHAPWRSICAGIITLVLISPSLIYNYKTIGYPVPEARLGIVMSKIVPSIYNEKATIKLPGHEPAPSTTAQESKQPVAPRGFKINSEMFFEFIDSVFKGFYWYFFIFAIPVIMYRIKKKQWKTEETIVLGALLGHAIILVVQIMIFDRYLYVSSRYLLPAAPLAFGWTAIAFLWLYDFLRERNPQYISGRTTLIGIVLIAIGLIADATGPLIKDFTSSKKIRQRQATQQIAQWIKQDYADHANDLNIARTWECYISNQSPVIACDDLNVVGYLSSGQNFHSKSRLPVDYLITRDINLKESKNNNLKSAIPVKSFKVKDSVYYIYRLTARRTTVNE